jgi:hypothetical protein
MRVTTSRARDHIVNISIHSGDTIAVGHRNQQYPEFVWGASEDGHHGWVPERCIEMTAEHEGVATCDYDASQLTVVKDELLEVLEEAGVWIRCRNSAGVEGWVPLQILEEARESRTPRGFPLRMRVTSSRVRDHIDDIQFESGGTLVCGHRNQVFPEFVWCATEDGRAGWAPESYLDIDREGQAVAVRRYTAEHLTVAKDEIVDAHEQIGVWIRCTNAAGHEGWVPANCLEPIDEE